MKLSFQKDERGVAHLALIVLAVVVLGAIGFVGYRLTQQGPKALNTAEGKKIQADCKAAIDDDDLCKFAAAMSDDNLTYSATLKMEGQDGTSTFKGDGKGNSQSKITVEGVDYETIYLDGNLYTKSNASDSWTKTPGTKDEDSSPFSELDYTFTNEDKEEYKKLGKEACGDRTCFKYQFIDKENPDDEIIIWFDTKDYLLRRMTMESEDDSTVDMSFSYEKVNITAPSPVSDAPAGSSTPTQAEIDALIEQYSN